MPELLGMIVAAAEPAGLKIWSEDQNAGRRILGWKLGIRSHDAALFFFDLFRQLAKFFGLLVAGFDLQMSELPGVLGGQVGKQGLQFRCYFMCVVGLFQHQMFKFPDCLVVIHRIPFQLTSMVRRDGRRASLGRTAEGGCPYMVTSIDRLRGNK
jgi:hypothetical protein